MPEFKQMLQCLVQATAAQLLIVSTASVVVLAANSSTPFKFLFMMTSGSRPDSSTVVSAVNQTLEEINMTFPFQLKYIISDTQVCDVYEN